MDERRKIDRKHLIYFGRVFNRKSGEMLGNMADITPEGGMIISNRPIETGKEFQLRLDLSEQLFGISHFDLDAVSIWCQPDLDPTFYNTGFKFVNLPEDTTNLIEKIVQQYKIRD